MVPSDPIDSIAHHRLARPETGIRDDRAFSPFAPRYEFCLVPDQRSRTHLRAIPDRDRAFTAAFHSPVTTASFKTTITGSTLPTCRFNAHAVPAKDPFDLLLPYLSVSTEADSTLQARCPSLQSGASGCFPALRFPLGFFVPFGSTRSSCSATGKPTACCARSPFAPRRRFRFIDSGFGSPFQARYAASGLLFLEPLGTKAIMNQAGF